MTMVNIAMLLGQEGTEVVQWVRDGGVIGLLLAILVGALRQWWVPGWHYRQILKERDEWRTAALKGTAFTEKTLTLSEEIAEAVERAKT